MLAAAVSWGCLKKQRQRWWNRPLKLDLKAIKLKPEGDTDSQSGSLHTLKRLDSVTERLCRRAGTLTLRLSCNTFSFIVEMHNSPLKLQPITRDHRQVHPMHRQHIQTFCPLERGRGGSRHTKHAAANTPTREIKHAMMAEAAACSVTQTTT